MSSVSEIQEKHLQIYGKKKNLSSWFLTFYLTSKRQIRNVSFVKRESPNLRAQIE